MSHPFHQTGPYPVNDPTQQMQQQGKQPVAVSGAIHQPSPIPTPFLPSSAGAQVYPPPQSLRNPQEYSLSGLHINVPTYSAGPPYLQPAFTPPGTSSASMAPQPPQALFTTAPVIPSASQQTPSQPLGPSPAPVYIVLSSSSPSQSTNSYFGGNQWGSGGVTLLTVGQTPPQRPQPTPPYICQMGPVSPAQAVNAPEMVPPQHQQGQQGGHQQQRPSHDVRQWGFAVVDQLHPLLPRVPLPPSAIAEETRGIGMYNNNVISSSTRPCTSQVCLLHAHTGCAAGRDCASFHVKPEYLQLSRAVSQPLCCALHNCFYTHEMVKSDCAPGIIHRPYCIALDTPPILAAGIGTGPSPRLVDISLLHLSMTVGLEALPVRGNKVVISLRRQVCRLHIEGRCKWTKDCGHVHVCRTFLPLLERKEVLDFLDGVLTETAATLAQRIRASPEVLKFVQSHAVLPMVAQLLRRDTKEALHALVASKVACITAQLDCLKAMNLAKSEADVTLVEVSPKIVQYLLP